MLQYSLLPHPGRLWSFKYDPFLASAAHSQADASRHYALRPEDEESLAPIYLLLHCLQHLGHL